MNVSQLILELGIDSEMESRMDRLLSALEKGISSGAVSMSLNMIVVSLKSMVFRVDVYDLAVVISEVDDDAYLVSIWKMNEMGEPIDQHLVIGFFSPFDQNGRNFLSRLSGICEIYISMASNHFRNEFEAIVEYLEGEEG